MYVDSIDRCLIKKHVLFIFIFVRVFFPPKMWTDKTSCYVWKTFWLESWAAPIETSLGFVRIFHEMAAVLRVQYHEFSSPQLTVCQHSAFSQSHPRRPEKCIWTKTVRAFVYCMFSIKLKVVVLVHFDLKHETMTYIWRNESLMIDEIFNNTRSIKQEIMWKMWRHEMTQRHIQIGV